jgi:hypothetical protein
MTNMGSTAEWQLTISSARRDKARLGPPSRSGPPTSQIPGILLVFAIAFVCAWYRTEARLLSDRVVLTIAPSIGYYLPVVVKDVLMLCRP